MSIKYKGDGAYFAGIPARDLSDDEFAALSEAQRQALLDSGVYAQEPEVLAVEAAPVARRKRVVEPEAVEPAAGG